MTLLEILVNLFLDDNLHLFIGGATPTFINALVYLVEAVCADGIDRGRGVLGGRGEFVADAEARVEVAGVAEMPRQASSAGSSTALIRTPAAADEGTAKVEARRFGDLDARCGENAIDLRRGGGGGGGGGGLTAAASRGILALVT